MMPYQAYLHSHVFLVVLYTSLFLIKLAFLFYGADERLAGFRRRTRILEMILPVLFIFTGIMLAIKSNQATERWFLIKMVALLMVIVLGIQTFKRNSKALGIFTLLVFAYIFAVSYQKTPGLADKLSTLEEEKEKANLDISSLSPEEHGKFLFTSMNCDKCHGEMGNMGYAGASDLTKSTLDDGQIKDVIKNGRKNMAPYGEYFNGQELDALTVYVKSLRE